VRAEAVRGADYRQDTRHPIPACLTSPPFLVAEDEESDVYFLRRALQKAGVANPLMAACNGHEAIRYLEGDGPFSDRVRHPLPALLLLDLKMPVMGGFEVLAWLEGRPEVKRFPVVVLTSSEEPADQEKARRLGAADYIVKPRSPGDLVRLVQTLRARWLGAGTEEELTADDADGRR
jgi:CheY-like chemotaxis protein